MIKDTSAQDVAVEAKRNTKKNLIIAVVSILCIALAAKAFFSQTTASRSFDRASVQVARVEVGDLVRDIVSNGRIVAANAPQIYSPEQGFVSLSVKAGDDVYVGQTVAIVDSPERCCQVDEHTQKNAIIKV